MSARFIAVAGNIGAGKSTLVRFLNERFALTPLYEPVEENPYLTDFYADMKTYSFHSQVFYLTRKYGLHIEAQQSTDKVVLDRSIYEDAEIFAAHLNSRRVLSKRDYRTYHELYKVIRSQVQPPDLLIYLKCSLRALRRRIKLRGRHEEQSIPISYLKSLNQRYDKWFEEFDLGPKAIIETDKLDYISDLVHRLELIQQIEDLLS